LTLRVLSSNAGMKPLNSPAQDGRERKRGGN
jgi:hypothetical protein